MLSAAAWVLMIVWLIIAENHRAFQEGSQQVLHDIEGVWGFTPSPAKSNGNWLTGAREGKANAICSMGSSYYWCGACHTILAGRRGKWFVTSLAGRLFAAGGSGPGPVVFSDS
jgi:hypothetical protein